MKHAELQHERGVLAPLYRGLGWTVNATSSAIHAKGVTKGIPDLYVQAEPIGLAFWHETKVERVLARGRKQVGRQSEDQHRFMERERAVGRIVILGDAAAAIGFLAWLGLGTPVGDTIRLVERGRFMDMIFVRHDKLLLPEDSAHLAKRWYSSREHLAQLQRWGWRRA